MSRRRPNRRSSEDKERPSDHLTKPLLGDYDDEDAFEKIAKPEASGSRGQSEQERQQAAADRHWQQNFGGILIKWLSWFESLPRLLGVWLRQFGSLLTAVRPAQGQDQRTPPPSLSEVQSARLSTLHARLSVPFDSSRSEHQEALRQLWGVAYPNRKLEGLVSEQWKDMGWQGTDPSTDFRGGGFISLQNLLYFAEKQPRAFERLLFKQEGKRAEWEYPFAVAGLNITFMLIELLDLKSEAGVPCSRAGHKFLQFLEHDENAFDNLYCIAFQVLDARWLAMGASYMEFNVVLRATRAYIEQELTSAKVHKVEDITVK